MGRRALPKHNHELDLSNILLTPDDLKESWSAEAMYGRSAPLEVEIGSGKGLFLQAATAANPDRDYFGIEIAYMYARHCASRLAKRELTNGRILAGDGLWFFREVLPEASVAAVHVYFPDPWWKKRHHKRRVLNTPFLKDVVRVLQPGGELHFWTDVKEYYDNTLELIAAETPLVGPETVDPKPAEHDLDYRTHFERRTRQAGEPVYRCRYSNPD